jgi:hypothetical protein
MRRMNCTAARPAGQGRSATVRQDIVRQETWSHAAARVLHGHDDADAPPPGRP